MLTFIAKRRISALHVRKATISALLSVKGAKKIKRLQMNCNTRINCTQIEPKHCIEAMEIELESMTDAEKSLSCAYEPSPTRMSSLTDAIIEVEGKTFRRESNLISRDAVTEAQTSKILELKTRLEKTVAELAEKKAEIESIRKRACKDAEQRHKLHIMIQELNGNIKGVCRVRPPTNQGLQAIGYHALFEYSDRGHGVTGYPPAREDGKIQSHTFTFDRVFDLSCSREMVFENGFRACTHCSRWLQSMRPCLWTNML